MSPPWILDLLRSPTRRLDRALERPVRVLTPWSDDAGEVWEPFLVDQPTPTAARRAA